MTLLINVSIVSAMAEQPELFANNLPVAFLGQQPHDVQEGYLDMWIQSDGNFANSGIVMSSKSLCKKLLTRLGVLPDPAHPPNCTECHDPQGMRYERNGTQFRWVCRRKTACGFSYAARKGMVSDKMHLNPQEFFCLVYCFVVKINVMTTQLLTGVSKPTVVQWHAYFREICVNWWFRQWVDENGEDNRLGGDGVVVEIDEIHLCTRKYNRGRILRTQHEWAFGGYERGTGRVFVARVAHKDAQTLIPILKRFVRPGTTIYSDGWLAYRSLDQHGFVHDVDMHTVIHDENFVNPNEPDCHTNNIERHWADIRANVSSYKAENGCLDRAVGQHLYTYEFFGRGNTVLNIGQRVQSFINHAVAVYPGHGREPTGTPDFLRYNSNEPGVPFRWPVEPVIGWNVLGLEYGNGEEEWREWQPLEIANENFDAVIEDVVADL